MTKVLYIARYHNPSMERKIAIMARDPGLALWLVRPSFWQDEYGQTYIQTVAQGYRVTAIPLLGRPNDWHRALYRTLTFAMHKAQPDIIHAEEEPDSLAALQIALARRLFAPKARLVLHTWQNVDRPKRFYVRWVLRTSLCCADAILCASPEARSLLGQMGYRGLTAVILPHGVDLSIFYPREKQAANNLKVAYVGRFVPEKGLDTLIEAIRLLNDTSVKLLLIGDGPIRAALEAQVRAAKMEDRISVVAPLPPEQLASLLGQCDMLVLPSRTTRVWKEQFGRVLVEAMACKVPVIGSDSGAIPEVIGDAGLIFPEGDAQALAERLRKLIASPALRQELAERGYLRATTLYSQERIAQQTIRFYHDLLKAKGEK